MSFHEIRILMTDKAMQKGNEAAFKAYISSLAFEFNYVDRYPNMYDFDKDFLSDSGFWYKLPITNLAQEKYVRVDWRLKLNIMKTSKSIWYPDAKITHFFS